jgi:hypothetical protein
MLDSEAVFASRALEIGLTRDEIATITRLGWSTYGKLAFASNCTPGQADERPVLELAAAITGRTPPPADRLPLVRRLVFESYTLAAAELRTRMERKEDDGPRKLTQAERAERHSSQAARLTGLDLTGEMEPSHTLVDAIFQMMEDNQLKYVRWEQCTKRDQELMGLKVDPTWKPDSNGVIRETRVREELKADVSTDLKLRFALQRRSLAFDQARLVDYDRFEKWTQILLEAYTASPPECYKKVSIEQVQHADIEMFKYLMKETRNGIRFNGQLNPLEEAIRRALTAPEIRLHLQPLPSSSGSGSKRPRDDDGSERPKPAAPRLDSEPPDVIRLQRQVANLQGRIRNMSKGGGRGRGRGRSGRGQNNPSVKMPHELLGQSAMTAENEPICFSYNLGGCDKASPGGRCGKGLHVCTKCQQPHSQRQHGKANP